jgi:glucosamine-phosphate N-acetyltransferase
MAENFHIRNIEYEDYNKGYLELLQILTFIEPDKITVDDFTHFINGLNDKHQIFVMEDIMNQKIIGTITILIEQKLIHNLGLVCHIEDVVVDTSIQNKGIGKRLVNKAIEVSMKHKCYKIILDCSHKNEAFYEKCDFIKKGTQMALYHINP